MRITTVTGFLGANPEVKTTKNGTVYTTLRLANHEYNDGENPYWYNVTIWEAPIQKFCEKLKKGSSVIVNGDYSNRIYTNRAGQSEISNDIRATAIYFGSSNRSENDDNASSTPNATTAAPTAVKVAPAPQEKQTPVQTAAPAVDDDLPF